MHYRAYRVVAAIILVAYGGGITLALANQEDMVIDDMEFGEAVSNAFLEEQSGRAGLPDQPLSNADLNARLNDNVVYSSINGNNNVGRGAFADSAGFPTVIQNSGNNVIIQNNTILNMTLNN